MLPAILVFGPSGSGKSFAAQGLVAGAGFLHIDFDNTRAFRRHGFPREWDHDFDLVDWSRLAAQARAMAHAEERNGVVCSFPTIHVIKHQHLRTVSHVGLALVVLWATEAQCIAARQERSVTNRVKFERERYHTKNKHSFETYAGNEYVEVRLHSFRSDGSRWSSEELTGMILARTAAQPSTPAG